jgi:flagellar biosynthesis protein FlhB
MSGEEDDSVEKEHAPSQKRLDDARQRGEFARSPDLVAAAGLAGFVLAALVIGGSALRGAGTSAMIMIDQPEAMAAVFRQSGQLTLFSAGMSVVAPLMPLLLLPLALVILVLFATRGIVFSTDKLAPKWSRISPLATAKQKFGLDGLFEFGKSAVKLVIMAVLLFVFLRQNLPAILTSHLLEPGLSTQLMLQMILQFVLIAFLVTVVLGGLDFGWQSFRHVQRNRMSRKEMMDEMKDSEGDPHVKGQRRQRGYDIATNRMLADVPTADVVIVNPTHYAVALKWKRGSRTAPVCVAKGVDGVAAQIRALAAEHGVPIHSDPPTARAIHAQVDVGTAIRPEHFKAVAAAIRFAEAMRAKARKTWRVS